MTTLALQLIPLAQVHESPLNPRKHFGSIQELASSLKAHGQLTAALVRPHPKKSGQFELAAGHRRFRAAPLAGLATLKAEVRELTDAEFVEILTIENTERADLHPLEEADGYRLLMVHAGYDVAKIAHRVNRSHDYVYDRLRLLQLTPALKLLFLEGRFQLSQAILLARLSSDEQARATVKPRHSFSGNGKSGLWRDAEPTLDPKTFPYVAVTAAELEYWIAHELRFQPEQVDVEELFPATAVALEAAAETGTRIVSITHDTHVRPNAKDQKERTFTRDFWKRADGLEGSKTCEYAVVGIVRVGDDRGEAIGVCLRRDKCLVHWKAAATAAAAKERAKQTGGAGAKPKAKKENPRAAAKQQAAQVKARVEFATQRAAIAIVEQRLKALHDNPSAAMVTAARGALVREYDNRSKESGLGLTAEQFIVWLATRRVLARDLEWRMENQWQRKEFVKECAIFGVDIPKILKKISVDHCKYCGCSDQDPCDGGCSWVSKKPFVCSAPTCVAQHQGKPALAADKDSDAVDGEEEDEGDDEE